MRMRTKSILYKTSDGEHAVMAMYDNTLKHWPMPYETQLIPTRHGNTFAVASGDVRSPEMILLHGAGGNSTMWAGDISDYSSRYRVYAVDLPGEAGKSTPNRPAWNSPAFAEWLEDVLNGLNINKVILVGISQGAWTALKFAVYMPERVEKLVLVAPGGVIPDRKSFLLRVIAFKLLGKRGTKRLVQALFADQQVPESVTSRVAEMSGHFKARIGLLPIFSDEELQRLRMPTLLLGGTKDIMRDLGKIEARLRKLMPNLSVSIISGAGHVVLNTVGYVMEFLFR